MLQKFAELPIGQAFVFEGQSYVKSSPLTGRGETGHERFLPRSALVETGTPAPPPTPVRSLSPAEVSDALRALATRMDELADELERRGDTACAGELRRATRDAFAELEKRLGFNAESEGA